MAVPARKTSKAKEKPAAEKSTIEEASHPF